MLYICIFSNKFDLDQATRVSYIIVNKKHTFNVAFINVMSNVITSIVKVSLKGDKPPERKKKFLTLTPGGSIQGS
jgi:hypothetical protein